MIILQEQNCSKLANLMTFKQIISLTMCQNCFIALFFSFFYRNLYANSQYIKTVLLYARRLYLPVQVFSWSGWVNVGVCRFFIWFFFTLQFTEISFFICRVFQMQQTGVEVRNVPSLHGLTHRASIKPAVGEK